jgi:uncharacterized protein YndB with AHSA1/START domain
MANRTAVSCSNEVEATPAFAFDVFTARLGDWWPIGYTFSGPAFADAAVEPRVGGEWYECTDKGERLSWGKVKAFEPGRRLVLEFGVGADRQPVSSEQSSTLEITFQGLAHGGTCVHVEHRDFERQGAGGAQLREGMSSAQGWPSILAELARGVRVAGRRPGEA